MELFGLAPLEIGARLLLGLLIGFCIGLTGVGGGVLVLPALTVLLRIDPIIAVGTTTLYSFLTKIAATLHHLRLKTIDLGTSLRFLAGAIPGNIVVALWVSRQGADPAFKQHLKTFIVYVVLFSVAVMVFNMISKLLPGLEKREHSLADRINRRPLLRSGLSLLLGMVCGGLIGATAIGGGVLIVPILIILFGLSASRTVGSAIFIAFILTLITSSIYGISGETDLPTALVMAAGSVGGVLYGSRLSVRMPELLLRCIVIGLVLAGAVMMLAGQAR